MNTRLKMIRKRHKAGKTQDSFAEFLGISKSNLASYESGRRTPSEAAIKLICQKCSVNEEWLRTGNGDMFINLTRDEKISSFIDEVMKDEDDSFRKRLLSGLVALDDNGWNVLEQFLNSINERGDSK